MEDLIEKMTDALQEDIAAAYLVAKELGQEEVDLLHLMLVALVKQGSTLEAAVSFLGMEHDYLEAILLEFVSKGVSTPKKMSGYLLRLIEETAARCGKADTYEVILQSYMVDNKVSTVHGVLEKRGLTADKLLNYRKVLGCQ